TSPQPVYQERYASLWMDVSEFESRPRRSTLSNCESPSITQTGVLYIRFKKVCNFSLPLPAENTMMSIRIDTGYEKVDTDYFPLEDIDMTINQEFCLPVCPGLALTITLHLMQAPHLQPRYHQQSPYFGVTQLFILDDHRPSFHSITSSNLKSDFSDNKSSINTAARSLLAAFGVHVVDGVGISFDISIRIVLVNLTFVLWLP
ncbi:hypothetical protein BG015_004867, partial [Linnemannia schmuckeri]